MGLMRAPGAHYEIVEGKAIVLDPSGKELLTLNPVGTLVWEALDGTLDVDGLTEQLLPQCDGVSRDELEGDIRAFVEELGSSELVVEAPVAPSS